MQQENIPSKETIGDRVRERRAALGLTQRALADRVGLSPAAISRMEAERDYVTSRPTIIALAQALQCDANWLAGGGTKPPSLYPAKEVSVDVLIAALDALTKLYPQLHEWALRGELTQAQVVQTRKIQKEIRGTLDALERTLQQEKLRRKRSGDG